MERKVKLQITGMEKKYKNGDGVENINIDVYEGEFVTMLGPSGCGKSTILRTLGAVSYTHLTGNMSFQFHIPHGIHELSVILTYEKERIQDPASYIERFRHPLIRQAVPYLGRIPTDRQLQEMVQAMKTEIQLCAMIGGVFAGNVHMPGTRKEILLKEGVRSRGCLPYDLSLIHISCG